MLYRYDPTDPVSVSLFNVRTYAPTQGLVCMQARAIHTMRRRVAAPMVLLRCAARILLTCT